MGFAWALAASVLFSVMGVFVKLSSQWFSVAELVFYRSLFGLLFLSVLLRLSGQGVRTRFWRWHLARGLAGAFALLCFFYAIAHLPLGSAIALNYTSPLFLALYLLLHKGQKPTAWLMLALLIGFSGVWVMLQPVFAGYSGLAVFSGLISGALAGFAYLAVRELGEQGESPERTVWYFTVLALLVSVLVVLPGGWAVPRTAGPWLLVGGMSLAATIAQLALTRAYRHGPALSVSCLAYSTVLFSTLAEYVLWQHQFSTTALGGQLLVLVSGVLAIAMHKRRG